MDDFKLYRKTIFECLNSLEDLKGVSYEFRFIPQKTGVAMEVQVP